jgi:hypothetical protein
MMKLKKTLFGLALVLALLMLAGTAMAEDSSSDDGGSSSDDGGQSTSDDTSSDDGGQCTSDDTSSDDGGQCGPVEGGSCDISDFSCEEWLPPYDGPTIGPDNGGVPPHNPMDDYPYPCDDDNPWHDCRGLPAALPTDLPADLEPGVGLEVSGY